MNSRNHMQLLVACVCNVAMHDCQALVKLPACSHLLASFHSSLCGVCLSPCLPWHLLKPTAFSAKPLLSRGDPIKSSARRTATSSTGCRASPTSSGRSSGCSCACACCIERQCCIERAREVYKSLVCPLLAALHLHATVDVAHCARACCRWLFMCMCMIIRP